MIRNFPGHDTVNPPGVIKYLRDVLAEGTPNERAVANTTLHLMETKPKLTFEQWYAVNEIHTYDKTEYECMKMAWNAAKENV